MLLLVAALAGCSDPGSTATSGAAAAPEPGDSGAGTDDTDPDDDSDCPTRYADLDGDGYGDPATGQRDCDTASDLVDDKTDCDDTNAEVHPGAREITGDEIDENCNGSESCFADADGDGYRETSSGPPVSSEDADCDDPGEAAAWAPEDDCDDSDGDIYPGAPDVVADGIDQDCDGQELCYEDDDDDGYIDASGDTILSADTDCDDEHEALATAPTGDCNEADARVNVGATEVCNGIDDDCDGRVDDEDRSVTGRSYWYPDADGDGFGEGSGAVPACEAPTGFIADASDCDDDDPAVNPSAVESCNGIDDDCDDFIDDDDPEGVTDASTWYADADGDTFGDPAASEIACDSPTGHVPDSSDCDDGDAARYPGAPELCLDGVVQDCDGSHEAALAECDTWGATLDADDDVATVTTEAYFAALAAGGDLDGDGVDDLAIGTDYYVPADAVSEDDIEAAIFVHAGPMSGEALLDDGLQVGAETTESGLGHALALADLDGDGMAALIAGANTTDGTASGSGVVYVFDGVAADRAAGDAILRIVGGAASEYAGDAVASIGDQDGDGFAEVAVGGAVAAGGAAGSGAAWIVPGAATGMLDLGTGADATLGGAAAGDRFGGALLGADLDGDGIDEFVVGAWGADAAYVFEGPVAGALAAADAVSAITACDRGGHALAAGDSDLDGLADLAVAAPGCSDAATSAGAVHVFSSPLAASLDAADAATTLSGVEERDRLGGSLSWADLDGDGAPDLAVTQGYRAYYGDSVDLGGGADDALLFRGPFAGSLSSADADVVIASRGEDVLAARVGADLDGDGWPDVVAGNGAAAWVASFPMY